MNKDTFEYYTYKEGREETSKLVWNVIAEDNGKIYPKNIFDCSYTFSQDLLYAKKHYADDKKKFSEYVRKSLMSVFWSRVEHEIIVGDVLNKNYYKLDIYTQVMINWDKFINYVWDNKNIITKKEK